MAARYGCSRDTVRRAGDPAGRRADHRSAGPWDVRGAAHPDVDRPAARGTQRAVRRLLAIGLVGAGTQDIFKPRPVRRTLHRLRRWPPGVGLEHPGVGPDEHQVLGGELPVDAGNGLAAWPELGGDLGAGWQRVARGCVCRRAASAQSPLPGVAGGTSSMIASRSGEWGTFAPLLTVCYCLTLPHIPGKDRGGGFMPGPGSEPGFLMSPSSS